MTIRQALAPFDILQTLLTDKSIVTFLKPRLKGISHLSEPTLGFESGNEYYQREVEAANAVYLCQLVVIAVTYAELIIKDFFYCLFLVHPQRMNQFLTLDGESKGKIKFNEVLQAESKETLIESLAERVAARAASTKIDKIVAKLVKESAITPQLPLIDDLKELNELRNVIVHEGKNNDVTAEQVIAGFGLVSYLLYILGEIAIKFGVVTLDEASFLFKSRTRLTSVPL